jgi:hypothetical protein
MCGGRVEGCCDFYSTLTTVKNNNQQQQQQQEEIKIKDDIAL